MALQFILGGAGRGKTWYIEHQVIREAADNPDRRFFVVVPEQFTMQTQKNLVCLSKSGGLLNIEVQSFLRLAFRIFAETGTANIPIMDDMGKTMILKKVLINEKGKLQYFGENVHKKGYITEIKSFLSELMQYGMDETGLEEMIETAQQRPVLQSKLKDMKVAYTAFMDYIKNHYITSEEVLTVFAEVVSESKLLRGSVLYLDGFTGFTPLQYRLLRELLKVCERVSVTVTLDPRESVWHVGEKYKLFHMSQKTIFQLRKLAEEEKIEISPEIWTGKNQEKTRYTKAKAIEQLEQNLFRYPMKSVEGVPEEISVHLLRQPDKEVEFLVTEILSLREQRDFRYREAAVVTGDLGVYGMMVKQAFERVHIPCFVDQKKSILTNPFVDMLCAIIDILRKDFDYQSVMRYLKSGFSGFDNEKINVLENFLLASGIRGHMRWQEEWDCTYVYRKKSEETVERVSLEINSLRQKTWEQLEKLYGQIARGKHTVREYAEAICEFLEERQFYQKILKQVDLFEKKGESEEAKEYSQIYEIVIQVFDRLVELMGTESVSLKEFWDLLSTGLEEARIGLIPPGVDQIMVGDLSRTRLAGIKYLFFLGMNEGNIPQNTGSGGILSEAERNFLTEEEYEIAPTSREQIYTEQFYLYLVLTKPSAHLYLTYSETGNDGSALRPAYIIDRVMRIFPELAIQVEENRTDLAYILSDNLGKNYLVQGLRNGWWNNAVWRELYRQYHLNEKQKENVSRFVEAAFYVEPASKISRMAAEALYQDIITGSTSQYEKYSSCPFSYFLQYGLKLEERQEHQVEFFDIGNIVHEALERYTKELLRQRLDWQDVSEEKQHILANTCLNETVEEYKNGLLYDTERDTRLIDRLRRIMHRTVWAITEQMKLGEFHTVESELNFRMDEEAQQLIGRVDRIDSMENEDAVYVKVIDYKTGQKDLSMADLYYGLQMQLVIYLKAAVDQQARKRKKMVIPAGVLYYHIDDPILDGKVLEAERETLILKELRMKGLVNETDPVLPSIDRTFQTEEGGLAASRKSIVAPFATNKNGGLTETSSTLTSEEFQEIIAFTEQKIQEIGEQIRNGATEVSPYQRADAGRSTPCEYCAYHSICRFDARLPGNQYRKLIPLSNDDVFAAIRKEQKKDETEMDDRAAKGN